MPLWVAMSELEEHFKAIARAEKEADEIKESARKETGDILSGAEKKGKEHVEDTLAAIRKESEELKRKGLMEAEEKARNIEARTGKELETIRGMAGKKREGAISEVIKEIEKVD